MLAEANVLYLRCSIVAGRAARHGLQSAHRRMKNANWPVFIAFMSALYMFLHALSGAGYKGELMIMDPSANLSGPLQVNATADIEPQGARHSHSLMERGWARLKGDVSDLILQSCPPELSTGVGAIADHAGHSASAPRSPSPFRTASTPSGGMRCLSQRLRRSLPNLLPEGTVVAKEPTDFTVPSVPQFPSLSSVLLPFTRTGSEGARADGARTEDVALDPSRGGNGILSVYGEAEVEEGLRVRESGAPANGHIPVDTSTGKDVAPAEQRRSHRSRRQLEIRRDP